VADGDLAVRDHVTELSRTFPAFKIAGWSRSVEETLGKFQVEAIDLLLLDAELVKQSSGGNLLDALREIQSDVRVLVVGKDHHQQKASFESGANGFLLKPLHFGELTAAVATVLDGKLFYSAELLGELPRLPRGADIPYYLSLPENLTDEDITYIHARLAGKSDDQIAEDLRLKVETISQRRVKIVRRLGLETDIESFLLRLTHWHMGPRRKSAAS